MYRIENNKKQGIALDKVAAPNCAGFVFTDNENIVINSGIEIDEQFLTEEGYKKISYGEAAFNPKTTIIGIYENTEDRKVEHVERWTGDDYLYVSPRDESGNASFAGGPGVEAKGGIKPLEKKVAGNTWDKTSFYITYERIEGIVDEEIDMEFDESGSTFGVSHGIKEEQKIRIISSKDFELAKQKLISK